MKLQFHFNKNSEKGRGKIPLPLLFFDAVFIRLFVPLNVDGNVGIGVGFSRNGLGAGCIAIYCKELVGGPDVGRKTKDQTLRCLDDFGLFVLGAGIGDDRDRAQILSFLLVCQEGLHSLGYFHVTGNGGDDLFNRSVLVGTDGLSCILCPINGYRCYWNSRWHLHNRIKGIYTT